MVVGWRLAVTEVVRGWGGQGPSDHTDGWVAGPAFHRAAICRYRTLFSCLLQTLIVDLRQIQSHLQYENLKTLCREDGVDHSI